MKRHLILLVSALAGIAAAENVPHNMVSRHTMVNTNLIGAAIGDGLSLTNGVLSARGGISTNNVEDLIASATNAIPRGRFVTDIDGAGHSITNSPMATTNFVWDVVGSVTNNLPSGGVGLTTNDVRAIVEAEGYIKPDEYEIVHVTEIQGQVFMFGDSTIRLGQSISDPEDESVYYKEGLEGDRELAVKGDIPAVNIPPLGASATVGDLVDAINAVADALRKEEGL